LGTEVEVFFNNHLEWWFLLALSGGI
jgi:hypothetical protein